MKSIRKPAWIATGLLSIAFMASLMIEERSELPPATQSVLMVMSVVIFYVILWFLMNAQSDRLDE
jgi:hypothetical protein